MINIQKVVTRNFVMDIVAGVQNILGLNLTSYERMISKGMEEIKKEIKDKNINLEWYRYEISQLTNGAMAIVLYGEEKKGEQ